MKNQKTILNRLLNKYENSKHLLDPGTSLRRVMLKVEKKDFPEYIYEDAVIRDAYNEAALELEKKHLVQLEWVKGRPVLSAIVLRLDQISQCYAFAERMHPKVRASQIIQLIDGSMKDVAIPWIIAWKVDVCRSAAEQLKIPVFCKTDDDFRRNSEEFTREYPVVLSTTYSIKGTLSIEHIYDYLIVDEASQVDLATGVLAFSCARNIVIVGDLKQLPNVLTEDDIRTSDAIWQKYSLDEWYRFSTHSLLSSALEIWQDAPVTLLREHYRCHPKIINFCNQKFYHGHLIVMTKDHDEPDVLTMYRTIAGNHARGHLNQRQIDVIQQEVLPRLHQQNFESIGIITPYRDQVTAIRRQLGDTYAVDTVHKFQGREQDAIILTSVDNVITDFVDDPHMLNVAVSRAVHSLAVVTSQDPRNDQTNYGDLTRYIEYNNFEVIQSHVYSVFDMLYQGYAEQRKIYLQKHKRVSEYDSENLMYALIQEVLSEEAFSSIGCAAHVSLATLVKSYEPLTKEERQYARNPLTHVDFLLFNQMDKQPVLAIEVDGTGFHEAGSNQAARDMKKNSILEKCAVPLLRLRTDGSGEKEKIRNALKRE